MKTGYKMLVSGVGGATAVIIAGVTWFGFSNAHKPTPPTTPNSPNVLIQVGPAQSVYTSQQNAVYSTLRQLIQSGQDKQVDASGFVQYVFSKVGVQLPRTFAQQAQVGVLVQNRDSLKRGDLVFFNLGGSGTTVTFAGIYLDNQQFVAVTTHGTMVLSLKDAYWSRTFTFGRRVLK